MVLTAGGRVFFVRDGKGKVAVYRVAVLIVQENGDIGLVAFAVVRFVKIEICDEGLMREYKERPFSVDGAVGIDDRSRENARREFVCRKSE